MTATVQPVSVPAPAPDPSPVPSPPARAARLGPAAATLGWGLLGAATLVVVWALVCTRTEDLPLSLIHI